MNTTDMCPPTAAPNGSGVEEVFYRANLKRIEDAATNVNHCMHAEKFLSQQGKKYYDQAAEIRGELNLYRTSGDEGHLERAMQATQQRHGA